MAFIDKIRLSEETKAQISFALRNPIRWMKGEYLSPDEVKKVVQAKKNKTPLPPRASLGGYHDKDIIAPAELLIFAIASFLTSIACAYTNKQDFLFREVYRIPANLLSVGAIATNIYDAFNDPFVGVYMDKKRLPANSLKWICRLAAVTGSSLDVIRMVDGGLSPVGHIVLFIACNCLKDTINTFDAVAMRKLRASISPYTQQRARVNIWESVAGNISWSFQAIPTILMGFKDRFGYSDYQIIFLGALIFLPANIIGYIMKTFIKTRVDFNAETTVHQEEDETAGEQEVKVRAAETPSQLSVKETIAVVKHNKYFIVKTICSLITVLTPTAGSDLIQFRYLAPRAVVFGEEMSGEGWTVLKDSLSGVLTTIVNPFARQLVNIFGGPLKAHQINSVVQIVGNLIKCFAGIRSVTGIMICIFVDNFLMATAAMDGVAENMLNYEFYDHVELKTGVRSEGVTTAVEGLLKKTMTDNIGTVTGNAALEWMGYRGGYLADGIAPPERYMKYVWPLATLAPVVDSIIWYIGRASIKWTPEDRERTEAALQEKREQIEAQSVIEA